MFDNDLLIPGSCKPDSNFINSVFSYDVQQLEVTPSVTLSKYIIGLSQYLIYFKSSVNKIKAELVRKERILETMLIQMLNDKDLKKFKTKKEAKVYFINNFPELNTLDQEINKLHEEIYLLDGVDKSISELIAALKRELTRRENELYQQRNS